MTKPIRAIALLGLATTVGCGVSYYREQLASHVPRPDGSLLNVECISSVAHEVTSISPTFDPEPGVTVIFDERTFFVTLDLVTLNGEPCAKLGNDVQTVRIEIAEMGFTIQADGEPTSP